jgi:hypothetical protein
MASLQKRASQHVLLKIGLERRGERAFAHPEYAAEGRWRGSREIETTGVPNTICDITCRFSVE